MQSDTIKILLDYVWIPIMASIAAIWTRLSGLDTRAQLLERSDSHYIKQRDEDRERTAQDRKEILRQVEQHHQIVMTKLDSLETRIKNGH